MIDGHTIFLVCFYYDKFGGFRVLAFHNIINYAAKLGFNPQLSCNICNR